MSIQRKKKVTTTRRRKNNIRKSHGMFTSDTCSKSNTSSDQSSQESEMYENITTQFCVAKKNKK
jgi:hypothetical protein